MEVVDPDEGITKYEYDPNGNKTFKEYPNYETAYYFYDVCDQIIEMDEYNLNGKKFFKTTYSWDAEGNMLTEMQYNHGQSGSSGNGNSGNNGKGNGNNGNGNNKNNSTDTTALSSILEGYSFETPTAALPQIQLPSMEDLLNSSQSVSLPESMAAIEELQDGIVTEEQVQKGYVWMNEVNKNIFDTTYEELVTYFGVEGLFEKEEYSDHMKANYRYYKWISADNDSHFIYVNFKEEEPGVYEVSAYNTSGFSSKEAIEKYLDIVKAEAAEANKAASANAVMKDFSAKIAMFAHDEINVTVKTTIPESGWSFDESGRRLVENDDPTAFGAGAIQFEVREKVEDFDYYKKDFENYQDIEDRVIGGITFHGRTYKYIGYEWIQYIAQIDDTRAFSIGLRDMDCVEGTMPDIILTNMKFQ